MERLREYSSIAAEHDEGSQAGAVARAGGWLKRGEVVIEGLEVTYRPGLAPVLQGVSMHIGAGEKVRCEGILPSMLIARAWLLLLLLLLLLDIAAFAAAASYAFLLLTPALDFRPVAPPKRSALWAALALAKAACCSRCFGLCPGRQAAWS